VKSSLSWSTSLVLAVTACRVGPEAPQSPPVTLPPAFAASAPDDAPVMSLQAFGDPVLDELVASALRDNRDVATALARLDEAAALAGIADAQGLPSLGFAADRQWQYASAQGAGLAGAGVRAGLVPRRQDVHRVGLTASWEIDLFGAVAHRRDAAAARAELATANVHGAALRVAAEVAFVYVELRHLGERLAVTEAQVRDHERLHELAAAALRSGVGSSAEVDAARAEWQRAAASPPRLCAARRASESRLAVLLGRTPGTFALPAPAVQLQVPAPLPLGVPSTLLRRRPDLLAAEAEVAAATAAIGIATADCYPRLFLLGSGGVEARALDRLGNRSALQGFGGPSLQLPLFQGGALQSAVTAAEAGQRAAVATFAQRILTALADVEAAAAQQRGERERLAAATAAADAAASGASRALALFASGLQAERSAILARLAAASATDARLQAAFDASLAAIALWKALGGDLLAGAEDPAVPSADAVPIASATVPSSAEPTTAVAAQAPPPKSR
jgi:NodT family efflux transporter outer membrane factor (OMF) lipoprotein